MMLTTVRARLGLDEGTGNIVYETESGMHFEFTLRQAIEFHRQFAEWLEKARAMVQPEPAGDGK